MVKEIDENIIRIVILDISGIYAHIHNQGYFDKNTVKDIQKKYSNTERWQILVLE